MTSALLARGCDCVNSSPGGKGWRQTKRSTSLRIMKRDRSRFGSPPGFMYICIYFSRGRQFLIFASPKFRRCIYYARERGGTTTTPRFLARARAPLVLTQEQVYPGTVLGWKVGPRLGFFFLLGRGIPGELFLV